MTATSKGTTRGRWTVPVILGALVVMATAAGPPTEVWTHTVDGGVEDDYATGVAIDSQGAVITAGYVQATPGWDGYVQKRGYDGVVDWSRTIDNPATDASTSLSTDRLYDVCVDSNDNVIVCGIWSGPYSGGLAYHQTFFIRKYDSAGTQTHEWIDHTQYAWSTLYSVTVDDADNIYVAGSQFVDFGTTAGQWAIYKFSPDLVVQSGFPIVHNHAQHPDIQDVAYDIAVYTDGSFVVAGWIGVAVGASSAQRDYDYHVRRYAADGTPAWNDTWSGSGNLADHAYGVALDGAGNAYVVGSENVGTDNASNGEFNGLIIKYAPDGTRLWTQVVPGDADEDVVYRGIAVDYDGTLSICGYHRFSGGDWIGISEGRDPSDGSVYGGDDIGTGSPTLLTAIDSRDLHVAFTGYQDPGSGWDYLTALYDLPFTNSPPIVDDPPEAGTDLAAIGEDVPFHTAAHDPDSHPITYAWEFGDGTTGAGSDPTHAYAAPGDYHVEVTVSDGIDDVEQDFWLTVGEPVVLPKVKSKLNFKKDGKDWVLLKCKVDLPEGFAPAGETLQLMIGGVEREVTLDAKGKYKDAVTKVRLKYQKKKATWSLTVKLKKGDFADDLADYGLTDVTQKKTPVEIKIALVFDDLDCAHMVPALYTAKQGKWGKSK